MSFLQKTFHTEVCTTAEGKMPASSLLSLPVELRLLILDFVFNFDQPLELWPLPKDDCDASKRLHSPLDPISTLLQMNQPIRDEALRLLRRKTMFIMVPLMVDARGCLETATHQESSQPVRSMAASYRP